MRHLRISIVFIVSILIFLGVIMIYSSSGVYAMHELGDNLYFLKRHLLFLLVGLLLAFLSLGFDYRDLRALAKPLMLLSIFLLVVVLIPGIGKLSFGARRWFHIGSFYFQPSEFAKLAILLYVADYMARKQQQIQQMREGVMPLCLVVCLACLLILKQPDLGSALVIASIAFVLLFTAGMRLEILFGIALAAIPAFYFLVMMVPYRWRRIMIFLDPWSDSQGAGFQLIQSQIALGSGGIFGVGLGKSMQKLFYLPAAHTDFILSIIGEELGFLGAFTVIVLFVCFIWQGTRIVKNTMDPFGYFLAMGIVFMIGLQAMVNVGVSIGALPTKGLPLPFISYGGSALIVNLLAVALLLNISRVQDSQS